MGRLSLVAPAVPAIASCFPHIDRDNDIITMAATIAQTAVLTYLTSLSVDVRCCLCAGNRMIWLGTCTIRLGGVNGDTTLYKVEIAFAIAQNLFAYPVNRGT